MRARPVDVDVDVADLGDDAIGVAQHPAAQLRLSRQLAVFHDPLRAESADGEQRQSDNGDLVAIGGDGLPGPEGEEIAVAPELSTTPRG